VSTRVLVPSCHSSATAVAFPSFEVYSPLKGGIATRDDGRCNIRGLKRDLLTTPDYTCDEIANEQSKQSPVWGVGGGSKYTGDEQFEDVSLY